MNTTITPARQLHKPTQLMPQLPTEPAGVDLFRVKVTLQTGAVKFSLPLGDEEFADRMAKQCLKDPLVKSAVAVPV